MGLARGAGATAVSPRRGFRPRLSSGRLLACLLLAMSPTLRAQSGPAERAFPQSKAAIEGLLKSMSTSLGGRLPTLDGFALPATHSLDAYQRGYFQAIVQIAPIPTGGSLVHVTVKITAWYNDAEPTRSGYQLVKSNGRIETDILDQLGQQLALDAPQGNTPQPPSAQDSSLNPAPGDAEKAAAESAATAKPEPAQSAVGQKPSTAENPALISAPAAKFPASGTFSASLSQGLAEEVSAATPPKTSLEKTDSALQAEADGLEKILKDQAHPNNLVAVKKSGTPVAATPSLTAKTLFEASEHDEFEMLDFNGDWVHVRISGLSRGWIWRNSVEMPAGISDTDTHLAVPEKSAADLFHVTRQEGAPFPGDWQALRGKNVEIVTVQKIDENQKTGGPQEKLEYAKYLFAKAYTELVQKKENLEGIVVVFDSADGGMIAAPVATLQQWKIGALSDAALWHQCFFDPPETFDSAQLSQK
jgi:hypothetical protein